MYVAEPFTSTTPSWLMIVKSPTSIGISFLLYLNRLQGDRGAVGCSAVPHIRMNVNTDLDCLETTQEARDRVLNEGVA